MENSQTDKWPIEMTNKHGQLDKRTDRQMKWQIKMVKWTNGQIDWHILMEKDKQTSRQMKWQIKMVKLTNGQTDKWTNGQNNWHILMEKRQTDKQTN